MYMYVVIANDVSVYINLLVRIAHIICNLPLYIARSFKVTCVCQRCTGAVLVPSSCGTESSFPFYTCGSLFK